MSKRFEFRSRKWMLLAAGLAAIPCLLFASPARAAEPDTKGWFLALDLALTQPTGTDMHLANRTDGNGPSPITERIVLPNDSDATLRGTIGYNFGLDMGALQVSYWGFDNDDEKYYSRTGFVIPALFGYGYSGYVSLCNTSGGTCDSSLPITFTGTSKIQASTIDLDYTRTLELGERFDLKWLGGLRYATYEEHRGFEGFDGTYTYTQARRFTSDAIGIKVGATGMFQLTQVFHLHAGATFSLLDANTDGRSSQTLPGFSIDETKTGKDDNARGEIRELELKGVWSSGPVDISLGLAYSTWEGLVKDPVPASGFLLVGEETSRDSVGFTSYQVGVKWRIGGKSRLSSP